MNETILIADDEEDIRESLAIVFESEGFKCTPVKNGKEALEKINEFEYDLLITDILMPKIDGMKLLDYTAQVSPQTIIVIMTAYGSIESAIAALRKGASDYLLKPLEFEELLVRVKQLLKQKQLILENKILRKQIDKQYNFNNIIGQSRPMKRIYNLIKQISAAPTNVLITGPSGTGKELVARAVHTNSNRSDKPFIPVNCGAIPDNLYESEFFGYKKGAFTGANADHDGLFKSANSGTLFLDEVADLPENVQVKLLRVLQEKEIRPVGSSNTLKVDVRILAATNKELYTEVQAGKFREDLYYRLNVVELKLPPLSERKDDIPLLVNFFIDKYNMELNRKIRGADNSVIKAFMRYEWKGNLRELENMIERAILLCEGEYITLKELPAHLSQNNSDSEEEHPLNLSEAMSKYEKRHILDTLSRTNGKRNEAAKLLGIDASTLYRKMQKLEIEISG